MLSNLLVPQTAADLYTLVGTVAALALLILALAERYWPLEAPVTKAAPGKKPVPSNTKTKRGLASYVLAGVACGAFILDAIDRRYFVSREDTIDPLTAENARIDVARWQTIVNQDKQFIANVFFENAGKRDASRWAFQGIAMGGGVPNDLLVDALYISLRNASVKAKTEQTIHPGKSDLWVSIPNIPPFIQLDDNSLEAYKTGKMPIFIFLVYSYEDDTLPKDKSIFGEKCIYVVADVVHNCAKHNREFIADKKPFTY